MTPPYIPQGEAFVYPGVGDQAAQAIGDLGQGIQGVIDPYHNFHRKLREAITANPDLLQRFADMAHENPDAFTSLGKLFPKDLMGKLENITPSPESIKRRAEGASLMELERTNPELFKRWMQARALGV